MKIFKLPDLGEGLPDAIIREWHVKEGDDIAVDQPLVSMETAKALVEVPSPFAGKIEKLFGNEGDTIDVDMPLAGFEGEGEEETADSGTVVGAIESSEAVIKEAAAGVAVAQSTDTRAKATPAVRALARRLSVDLDSITPAGSRITAEEVKAAANSNGANTNEIDSSLTALTPIRRAMVMSMSKSHQEIVPVTLSDDADIEAWYGKEDLTVRLLRALQSAIKEVPMLNSHFFPEKSVYQENTDINIGLAVDTPHGLYVPVLKNVADQTDQQLRDQIEVLKQQAKDKAIPQNALHGATITLSNFGAFAGKYASPIITQPMVAIIGVGRARDAVVSVDRQPAVHRIVPLSVTIDHRLVTGGEAARFLRAMMDALV